MGCAGKACQPWQRTALPMADLQRMAARRWRSMCWCSQQGTAIPLMGRTTAKVGVSAGMRVTAQPCLPSVPDAKMQMAHQDLHASIRHALLKQLRTGASWLHNMPQAPPSVAGGRS